MSGLPLCEEFFEYPTPSLRETGPLRLLSFDASTTGTSLSLSLFHAKQEHTFFAVSYAWGDPVCKASFGLNGSVSCAKATHGTTPWTNNQPLCNNYLRYYRTGSDGYRDLLINGKKFYVQDTVYDLLCTLWASTEIQQRLREGEYFWLDAICVNQNSKCETDQQTRIMHEIYQAARYVYVWLGPAYDSSDIAMDFMYYLETSTRTYESVRYISLPAQSHSKDLSWQVCSLLDRPYWRRTWVIQEFLLAQDTSLLCGNRSVPCIKVESLVDQIDGDYEFRKRYPQWTALPGVRIIQARKAFQSFPVKPSLVNMIHHFLFSRSTYPEDKLIGLLNVSLSNVETGFHGEPGSISKRVDVINEIVRDSQDWAMDEQTKKEWKWLLACLLGVRGGFDVPETIPITVPIFTTSLPGQRRSGPAATSPRCDGAVDRPQAPPPRISVSNIVKYDVGNVQVMQRALQVSTCVPSTEMAHCTDKYLKSHREKHTGT